MEQLWKVRLEVEKDKMYVRKGMILEEVIFAENKESAIQKAMLANDIDDTVAVVLGAKLFEDGV